MLTPEEVDEIDGRCKAATPGEWGWMFTGKSKYGTPGFLLLSDLMLPTNKVVLDGITDGQDEMVACDQGDREFIAHSRTDVPRLVADWRRMRADLDRSRVQLAGCSVAAWGYDLDTPKDAYGWSASFGDVVMLRRKFDAVRRVLDAADAAPWAEVLDETAWVKLKPLREAIEAARKLEGQDRGE